MSGETEIGAGAVVALLDAAIREWEDSTPGDVERLHTRRGANEQGFTVEMGALHALDICKSEMALLALLVKREGVPISVLDEVAASRLVSAAGMFELRFSLTDAAEAGRLVAAALTGEHAGSEVALLLDGWSEYLRFLQNAVRVAIPWHELSCAFEGSRVVNGAYWDRMA